jgi:mono/diheme cytochrome c family protein
MPAGAGAAKILVAKHPLPPGVVQTMARSRLSLLLTVAAALFAQPVLAAERPLPRVVDFNRDIRPIFSENCYACHGPDKNKRKADLRLDTHDGLFSTHEGRVDVVVGKPGESELFRRITEADPAERMPDPKSNKRLADRQIALIKKWIEQGAPWKDHWAYLPPSRPTPPEALDAGFVRNPIDQFVLAGLKDAGLSHAAEADRVTLIRRLSFDLLGMAPTRDEVRQFVDDTTPDAYERLVNRMISSPHYGERMACWWLDLVRYADSIGYHSDNPMNVWPYRDYVIGAFNKDMPFDQFTREQIAGDLLPNATQEQKVASCYNRLIETTEEGGAQAREYVVKYECDRVRNISSVWLAATMGCSQCHDHKFDPYTQKDFYRMAAFFADVQEAAVGRREAGMPVLDGKQAAKLKELDGRVAGLSKRLEEPSDALAKAQEEWEQEQLNAHKAKWVVLDPDSAKSRNGSVLTILPDGSVLGSKFVSVDAFTITAKTHVHGIKAVRMEALPDASLPAGGPGSGPNGNFVLQNFSVQVDGSPVKFSRAVADHSQTNFPVESLLDSKQKKGWGILPEAGKAHVAVFETETPVGAGEQTSLTISLQFPQSRDLLLGHFRISVSTDLKAGEVLSIPGKVRAILVTAPEKRDEGQKKEIAAYYRSIAPLLEPARKELAAAKKAKDDFLNEVPKCLVSVSGPPRTVKLLHRGDWLDDSGEVELPGVPHFLPQPASTSERLTRLDLANWLVSRDNPLVARVVVNRLWKLFFGVGISKSLDDLGSQGESPTNPELLDYLATELVDSGWDIKHVVRLMVESGTYRQSSAASSQAKEVDPFNRLYSHQSRFRLDAEMIRDSALEFSGLLSPRMGGPSVKPYQPAGFWDPLNFPPRKYVADEGENQYRRGLYTWWQRTFPHPSLTAFDAPTREESTCERLRSNIPQQALVLLNDPTYVEAARVFAARVIKEGGDGVASRLNFAFETALDRKPSEAEGKILTSLYEKHLREYSQDTESAKKLLATGQAPAPEKMDAAELAAWTNVCRTIINLSETITRS